MTRSIEAAIAVPHGVVFVHDPTMLVDIPPDTGAAAILATRNCLSIWTVHEVDGPTALVLAEAYDGDDCALVFEGELATEGCKLAFNTSYGEPIIEADVAGSHFKITIYANDPDSPSQIVCVAALVRR